RVQQDRPRRPARPPQAREPLSRRAAGLCARRRGARRAARRARPALRGSLGARAPARPVRGRRTPLRALRARHAGRAARGHAGRRAGRGAPPAPRPRPVRAVPDRGRDPEAAGERLIELPVRKLRPDAVVPTRAYPGDAGLDLAACDRVELAPGERALVATGLAVAIPDGYAGFVQPRSGLAAKHGISIV